MTAEFFEGFLATPFVGSLFLEAALVLLLRVLTKTDGEGITPWFYALAAFLFARDIAAAALPFLPVSAFSDALVPFFFLSAASPNERRKKTMGIAAATTAAGIGAAWFFSSSMPFLPALLSLGAALLGAFFIYRLKDTETGIARLLSVPARAAAFAAILLPPLVSLAFGNLPFLRYRIFAPLSLLAFIFVALDYARALQEKILSDRDYLSDTIDKLYGFVFHASSSLRGGVSLDGLLDYVARSLSEETNADGALVLMVDDFEDLVTVRAISGSFAPISAIPEEIDRDPAEIAAWLRSLRIPLGEGLIGLTAQNGKASFIPDAASDGRVVVEPALPAGSVITVPFLIEDRVIGVGVVVRNADSEPFADADFDRVSLLADFASLIINDVFSFMDTSERGELDREAAIAANIQKALQPKRVLDAPTASFGTFSTPARGVSSDYYDVIPVRRDRIYLVMGDVAGKGVPASLIMVMIRAILHLLVSAAKDTATILNWINRGITGKIDLDHFATLQVLAMDPTTGRCEFANAGHRPPLVWKKSTGTVQHIEMKSVPIGVEKSNEYAASTLTLESGDILLMYTDGVVEAVNPSGRQYGTDGLNAILENHNALSTQEIAQKIHEDVRAFIGGARQHDDQTVLAVKVKL